MRIIFELKSYSHLSIVIVTLIFLLPGLRHLKVITPNVDGLITGYKSKSEHQIFIEKNEKFYH